MKKVMLLLALVSPAIFSPDSIYAQPIFSDDFDSVPPGVFGLEVAGTLCDTGTNGDYDVTSESPWEIAEDPTDANNQVLILNFEAGSAVNSVIRLALGTAQQPGIGRNLDNYVFTYRIQVSIGVGGYDIWTMHRQQENGAAPGGCSGIVGNPGGNWLIHTTNAGAPVWDFAGHTPAPNFSSHRIECFGQQPMSTNTWHWVRHRVVDGVFSAFYSPDGENFTQIGEAIDTTDLAMSTHSACGEITETFDDFQYASGSVGWTFFKDANASGFIMLDDLEILDTDAPAAAFSVIPRSGPSPLIVKLDASASSDLDGTIEDYSWDFGDESMGSGEMTSHTYAEDGSYTITLTVTDNDGKTDSTQQVITVAPPLPPANFSDDFESLPVGFFALDEAGTLCNTGTNGNYDVSSSTPWEIAEDPTDPENQVLMITADFGDSNLNSIIRLAMGSEEAPGIGRHLRDYIFTYRIQVTIGSPPGGYDIWTMHRQQENGAAPGGCSGGLGNPFGNWLIHTTNAGEPVWDFVGNIWGDGGPHTSRRVGCFGRSPLPINTWHWVRHKVLNGVLTVYLSADGRTFVQIGDPIDTNDDSLSKNNECGEITGTFDDLHSQSGSVGWTFFHDTQAFGSIMLDDITITDSRLPRVAFALEFTSGAAPLMVNMDASASSDEDGAIVSYEWDFGDDAMDTGVMTSHTYTENGNYTVTLTVTDNDGLTSTAQQDIRVAVPPPTASFTSDVSGGFDPLVVNFDASASSDQNGTITDYSWDFGDEQTGNGVMAQYTYLSTGIFTVSLTVMDNDGETSAPAVSQIIVPEPGGFGGIYTAEKATITIDGDPSEWNELSSNSLEQTVANPLSADGGRSHEIRFAWDDDNFYVLVEEVTVDSTPKEGVDEEDWSSAIAGGLSPWSTDSVGFYDAPTYEGGPTGPGPAGSTGPITQFWVGMASDGNPGRHQARSVPEQGPDFLIEGQNAVSVTEEGTRICEFFMPWSDIKYEEFTIQEGFLFRLDPLMVDGVGPQDSDAFNGQSFPGGATVPGDVQLADMSFVQLVGGVVAPQFRRGDHDGSGAVDMTDTLNLLRFLFLGQFPPICEDASDYDNSAAIDMSDGINSLTFLFLGGNVPPPPGTTDCGPDPTEVIHDGDPGNPLDLGPDGLPLQLDESLGCETYPSPDSLPDAACSP